MATKASVEQARREARAGTSEEQIQMRAEALDKEKTEGKGDTARGRMQGKGNGKKETPEAAFQEGFDEVAQGMEPKRKK